MPSADPKLPAVGGGLVLQCSDFAGKLLARPSNLNVGRVAHRTFDQYVSLRTENEAKFGVQTIGEIKLIVVINMDKVLAL